MSDETEKPAIDRINLDDFQKGDVLDIRTLQTLVGFRYGTPTYQLKIAELSWEIERRLKQKGRHIVVSCEEGRIIFHTDESASDYSQRKFRDGERKLRRNQERMLSIDPSGFDQDMRRVHDRAIVIQGAKIAGLQEAARKATFIPYKRNTPGVPQSSTEVA